MGLNIHTLNMLNETLDIVGINDVKGLNICELGNLMLRKDVHSYLDEKSIPHFKTAKEYFEYIGMNDTSFDWNGKDGVIKVDLGKPLPFDNRFDIVLNGGTSEHVYDQYQVWKNIHTLSRDGVVISVGPLINNWLKHSPYRYSLEFFDCLCFLNDYDLIERKVVNFKNKDGFDCHYISYKNNGGDFIGKEKFKKIWNNHHKEKII